MDKNNNLGLRAGIIGASGIGLVHARIYNEIGVNVVAILSSDKLRSIQVSSKLKTDLNISVKPFYNIDDFLDENLDLISICSTPKLHFDHIMSSFNKNVPVFCEKPLLDISKLNTQSVLLKLNDLKNHSNRNIYVNTSNTTFVDSILENKKLNNNLRRIRFEFFTNGPYSYLDIALDLLPHAYSILIHLFKEKNIENFDFSITRNKFTCNFKYGDIVVEFDLREDINGPKHMLFCFDGDEYIRKQSGQGNSYQVYLLHSNLNKKIICEDPFKIYMKKFINSIDNPSDDKYDEAELTMKLILKTINIINKSKYDF